MSELKNEFSGPLSLLIDVSNNISMEEDRFSKMEDELVNFRCYDRTVCRN